MSNLDELYVDGFYKRVDGFYKRAEEIIEKSNNGDSNNDINREILIWINFVLDMIIEGKVSQKLLERIFSHKKWGEVKEFIVNETYNEPYHIESIITNRENSVLGTDNGSTSTEES